MCVCSLQTKKHVSAIARRYMRYGMRQASRQTTDGQTLGDRDRYVKDKKSSWICLQWNIFGPTFHSKVTVSSLRARSICLCGLKHSLIRLVTGKEILEKLCTLRCLCNKSYLSTELQHVHVVAFILRHIFFWSQIFPRQDVCVCVSVWADKLLVIYAALLFRSPGVGFLVFVWHV